MFNNSWRSYGFKEGTWHMFCCPKHSHVQFKLRYVCLNYQPQYILLIWKDLIIDTDSAVDMVDDKTNNLLKLGQARKSVQILKKLKDWFYIINNQYEEDQIICALKKYQNLIEEQDEYSIDTWVISFISTLSTSYPSFALI